MRQDLLHRAHSGSDDERSLAAWVDNLLIENSRLRAALAWYSNHENYTLFHSDFTDDANIHHDNGQRARAALEVTDDLAERMAAANDLMQGWALEVTK